MRLQTEMIKLIYLYLRSLVRAKAYLVRCPFSGGKTRGFKVAPVVICRGERVKPAAPFSREQGQAILELAIFGSLLIVLFGFLIAFGLRYSYQQQVMQYTFRKALAETGDNSPTPTSQLVLRDRHIPDGEDPFAVGTVTPIYSTASVTRSNILDQTADYSPSEMPRANLDVGGSEYIYTTADFCYYMDGGVTPCQDPADGPAADLKSAKRRLEEVYGPGTFWRINPGNGDVLDWDSGEVLTHRRIVKQSEPPFNRFLDWLYRVFPGAHFDPEDEDEEIPFAVEVMDECASNLLGYDNCVRQCRLIVDDGVCMRACVRSGGDDCGEACGRDVPTPWYCQGYTEVNSATDEYRFPVLRRLFDNTRFTEMGLQRDNKETIIVNNRLDITEDAAGMDGVEREDWRVVQDRKIHYVPQGLQERATTNVTSTRWNRNTRGWWTPH